MATRTNNPIRAIVDNIKFPEDSTKKVIPLSLGDPTVFGNLPPPQHFIDRLADNLKSGKFNGYVHSAGTPEARAAIAAAYGTPTSPLTADDVVVACGCSGALDLAIGVLLQPGDKLLVPQPGFPLYETLARSKGVEVGHYKLNPDASWQVDLESLRAALDSSVRAIVVNNPSNPCGSVYPVEHLRELLAIAEEARVPIVADEIYGDMTYGDSKFVPMASLTETVPILSVGGIAKQFLVPGWRVGWVCVHDRAGLFADIRTGLFKMSQLILGANSLIQSALPMLLAPEAGSADAEALASFKAATQAQLAENARFTAERLSSIPGLRVIVPQGAMYVMIGVDSEHLRDIEDDVQFCQALLSEQSVFMLPGQCFGMRDFARVVFSAPKEMLAEAYDRIEEFCKSRAC